MKKYAWTWNVYPESLDEYVKMHKNPWPEIMEAHSKAGIRNYSIFQNGTQFFYVFECDDIGKTQKYLDEDPDCQRWNAITSKMVEGGSEWGKKPVKYMEEVFYLE